MKPTVQEKLYVEETSPPPESLPPVDKSKKTQPDSGGDTLFRWLTAVCAIVVPLVMGAIFVALLYYSWPALRKFGVGFFFSQEWNPVTQEFGAASSIYGTLLSTIISMMIAVPLSLAIALFLVELAPPRLSRAVGTMLELLAAIPSIIYGMWGMFVFAPLMAAYVQPFLKSTLGFLPLFQGPPMGLGMLTAGIILGFMVLPFTCAITRDVFRMVPNVVKESAYGMGATTWEVTLQSHHSLRPDGYYRRLFPGAGPGSGGNHGRHLCHRQFSQNFGLPLCSGEQHRLLPGQ